MKFEKIVGGIAPTLLQAGFRELSDPGDAPPGIAFAHVEAGDVLRVEFTPMPTPPGRSDFRVELRAGTANWTRYWPTLWPDPPEFAVEWYPMLWQDTLKLPPGFPGIGDTVWAVTQRDAIPPLQVAVSQELTKALPRMRADMQHLHVIETSAQRNDGNTERFIFEASNQTRHFLLNGGPNAKGYLAWLHQNTAD